MKPFIAGALASITALGLLAGCGSDAKSSAVTERGTIPVGETLPQEVIDKAIADFEAAGMKVDKACFTALLKDDSLRQLAEAGGTPTPDVIKKFFTCLST
jgi:ABC-type glycerol-3-phosphate transport system substrate-binding protein